MHAAQDIVYVRTYVPTCIRTTKTFAIHWLSAKPQYVILAIPVGTIYVSAIVARAIRMFLVYS